jgi:DNA-binding ferritin-like protein
MSVSDIIDDRAYFTRRAREERECASTCKDKTTAVAHLKMADECEKHAKVLSHSKPRMVYS